MVNWPGWNAGSAGPAGSIRRVTESWVSTRRPVTRYGTGSIGSPDEVSRVAALASAFTRAPVQIEQPGPGALQPREQDLEQPERERVAQRRILIRKGMQPGGVQQHGRDGAVRRSGEVPVVRRHQP